MGSSASPEGPAPGSASASAPPYRQRQAHYHHRRHDRRYHQGAPGALPLADSVMDSVQFGAARVYCLPVAASTAGTVGEVEKEGKGGGTLTASGSPYNAFAVVVRITAQGTLNTAAFTYSIDGGNNFSDEITVPVAGKYELPGLDSRSPLRQLRRRRTVLSRWAICGASAPRPPP